MKTIEPNLDIQLTERFQTKPAEFPRAGTVNYPNRYQQIAEKLTNDVHPYVTLGATLKDGGLLTAHGADHVETLIARASRLASAPDCYLSGYEIYLLLVAAQLHDCGNILGRAGHEMFAKEMFKRLGTIAGDDSIEHRLIAQIAQAHGGTAVGDKDKIRFLLDKTTVLGCTVRPRLLAALVRFADELADDRQRAASFLLAEGRIPVEAEVYHRYADALHSVEIDHQSHDIRLSFDAPEPAMLRTFGRGKAQVYLLDEIVERTLKTHCERIYCMRFVRGAINLERIRVTIEVYQPDSLTVLKTIHYDLEEAGFPGADATVTCQSLTGYTGAGLMRELQGGPSRAPADT